MWLKYPFYLHSANVVCIVSVAGDVFLRVSVAAAADTEDAHLYRN